MVHANISTVLTEANKSILVYSAIEWARIKLRLASAGPVAAGTDPNLFPIGQGKGILLTANDTEIILTPGDRIYLASDAANNVSVVIEAIPEALLLQGVIEAIRNPTVVVPTETVAPRYKLRF